MPVTFVSWSDVESVRHERRMEEAMREAQRYHKRPAEPDNPRAGHWEAERAHARKRKCKPPGTKPAKGRAGEIPLKAFCMSEAGRVGVEYMTVWKRIHAGLYTGITLRHANQRVVFVRTQPGYGCGEFEPRPGEERLGDFIKREVASSGFTYNSVYGRVMKGKYALTLRRVDHGTIFVKPKDQP